VEILCVGNELLIGRTLNTNATWLAKRITSLGLIVKRITVVGDEVDEIAEALREALRRKPKFVVMTGGLGPTFDDKTLEGIARGLNRRLEVSEEALKMVRKKYEEYHRQGKIERVEMTPPRVKMATFPEGTEPLPNPVGTAPAMLAKVKEVFIIALPGVPPEMEAIFNDSLVEIIKKEAGRSGFFEASIHADGIMESNLAPLIDQVMQDCSHVYIKSHVYMKSQVQVEGRKSHIELHFSTRAIDPKTARTRLNRAIGQLSELVQKNGGRIRK
jgi:nicotinamide-nucleotide amidase